MELRIWILLVLVTVFGLAIILTCAAVIFLARRVVVLERVHGIGEGGDVRTHPHTCTRP